MEMLWFAIVCSMLAVYVVLDGFDFGAGILHRLVARTDQERRTVLAAIGPVWDGNEVWLIASGGVLFLAFPKAYSAAFSGFYLALMIVLWLLILRGVSIEFRSQLENPLWREFWDTTFAFASTLLAVVLGTSLGNVVRGVPLDATGFFAIPLFTTFRVGGNPGIFDWYTALVGAFTLCVLAGHGALYLTWKTAGAVHDRSRAWARRAWLAAVPLWVIVTLATAWVAPENLKNLIARPWFWALVPLMCFALWGALYFTSRGQELAAFLSSSLFLLCLMAATMAGNYPALLKSTIDTAYDLTATNTAAAKYGLQAALYWWTIGISLATSYFVYLFRSTRGKVEASADGHGY
jgi:cytochrome bd ubiquinol oxidase subunit II